MQKVKSLPGTEPFFSGTQLHVLQKLHSECKSVRISGPKVGVLFWRHVPEGWQQIVKILVRYLVSQEWKGKLFLWLNEVWAHHKGSKVHNSCICNIWPFNFQFQAHQPVPGVCNGILQLLSISKFYSGFRLRSPDCWLWELSDILHSISNYLIWFSNSKNAINPKKKFIAFEKKKW